MNDYCPVGCICELFAYLSNLAVYSNCSDMNELVDIASSHIKEVKNDGN